MAVWLEAQAQPRALATALTPGFADIPQFRSMSAKETGLG